jgi:hypothetical protein
MEETLKQYTNRIAKEMIQTLRNNVSAEKLRRKQAACAHKNVDKPGSVFGETCTNCGLYLNNGR